MTQTKDRAAALATALTPMGASMATLPILARNLPTGEFGLWAVILAGISIVQLMDGGIGASLFRFMAEPGRAGHETDPCKILRTAAVYYLAIAVTVGVVLAASLPLLTPTILGRTNGSAAHILALVTLLLWLTPVSNSATTMLQAGGRFVSGAVGVGCGQAIYVFVVGAAALGDSLTIIDVLAAQLAQMIVITGLALTRSGVTREWLLLSRVEVVRLARFGGNMWLVNLSNVVVLQFPLILVAQVEDPHAADVYSMAAMLTLAARNLPLFTINPILRRIAQEVEGRYEFADRAHKRWRIQTLVYLLISSLLLPTGVLFLGGQAYVGAIAPALLLHLGYTIGVLTAVQTGALRQFGMPRLERRASLRAAMIHLVILLATISLLGVHAPGLALVCSQTAFALMIARSWKVTHFAEHTGPNR